MTKAIAEEGRSFGCACCLPSSVQEAWEVRMKLVERAQLVDESHFRVRVLACTNCSQKFLSIFSEIIDWCDGDDGQSWTTMPITLGEFVELASVAGSTIPDALRAIAPTRRSLRRDHPTGCVPQTFWDCGIALGSHD